MYEYVGFLRVWMRSLAENSHMDCTLSELIQHARQPDNCLHFPRSTFAFIALGILLQPTFWAVSEPLLYASRKVSTEAASPSNGVSD